MKIGTIDPLAEQKHLLEVQMKCDSGSDLWVCELDVLSSSSSSRDGERPHKKTSESMAHDQAMDIDLERQFDHSGLHNPRAFSAESQVERNMFHVLDGACERAPSCCNPRSLYKRKLELLGAEMAALEKRKKQCMVGMEQEEGGSAADPRWSHLTTEWHPAYWKSINNVCISFDVNSFECHGCSVSPNHWCVYIINEAVHDVLSCSFDYSHTLTPAYTMCLSRINHHKYTEKKNQPDF